MREINQTIANTDPKGISKDFADRNKSAPENNKKKSSKFLNKRSLSKSKEEISTNKSFLYMSKDYDKLP